MLKLTLSICGIFLISACGLDPIYPKKKVSFSIDLGSTEAVSKLKLRSQNGGNFKPSAASGFDCYFVSVSASDISGNLGSFQSDTGVDPTCSQLGLKQVSKLVSAAAITSESGEEMTVASGSNRMIRIFGVMNTSSETTCAGKVLKDLFDAPVNPPIRNFRPSIYLVGESTNVDLTQSKSVTIASTYNASSAVDAVSACSSLKQLPIERAYKGKFLATDVIPKVMPTPTPLAEANRLSSLPAGSGTIESQTRPRIDLLFSIPSDITPSAFTSFFIAVNSSTGAGTNNCTALGSSSAGYKVYLAPSSGEIPESDVPISGESNETVKQAFVSPSSYVGTNHLEASGVSGIHVIVVGILSPDGLTREYQDFRPNLWGNNQLIDMKRDPRCSFLRLNRIGLYLF